MADVVRLGDCGFYAAGMGLAAFASTSVRGATRMLGAWLVGSAASLLLFWIVDIGPDIIAAFGDGNWSSDRFALDGRATREMPNAGFALGLFLLAAMGWVSQVAVAARRRAVRRLLGSLIVMGMVATALAWLGNGAEAAFLIGIASSIWLGWALRRAVALERGFVPAPITCEENPLA